MSKSSLKRGIVQILVANVINMLFSIATNFLLPKFLSTDSYAQIKSYQLYITYVGVLHFGYGDGTYLKYGGKDAEEIDKKDFETNLSTLRIFQLVITAASVIVALFFNDPALLMAAIAILPQNIIEYFKLVYQSIGEFKRYSRIMNLTTAITFLINILLIAVIRTDTYIYYLIGYVLLLAALWIALEYTTSKRLKTRIFSFIFSWRELKNNISSGILLMLGNLSSMLLTGMDRFFVKALLNNYAFAQYSFAVSVENFLNLAVTPVSITMYNYFCKHDEKEDVLKIRELIMAFASVIVVCAFPIKFILEIFLQNYMDSSSVIFLLFAAQMFYVMIKCVYVNLYKARKMQKRYFSKLCIIVVLAFVFNVVCFIIYHHMVSFAVGTLFSAIVWFFLSQLDFKELKYKLKHYFFIFSELIVFLLCGFFFNSIVGCLIYIAFTVLMLYVCVPYSYKQGISMLKSFFARLKSRQRM